MAYKSEAQKAKFKALVAEGKMKPEVAAGMDKDSKGQKLPERIHPKKIKSIEDIRAKIKK